MQANNDEIKKIMECVKEGKETQFHISKEELLCFCIRLYVPHDTELRNWILKEAHSSPYAINAGSTKTSHDVKQYYW